MASAGNSGSGDDDSGGKLLADRYQKGEVLGEGTYGVVFKAIDTKVPLLSRTNLLNPPFLICGRPQSRELELG
jgi:serine/threonine protein kinase